VTTVFLLKTLPVAAEFERSVEFRIWHRQFVALRQLSDKACDGFDLSPGDKPKPIADSTSIQLFADLYDARSIALHDDG
jgi:hypothetical protein